MALRRSNTGFTLIELMVTVAVMLVLMLLAVPSFQAQRQRAALRGAGEEMVNVWNQARLESAKRNQMVKVGIRYNNGDFCVGANTATSSSDTTTCDCLSNACDVANFPGSSSQGQWDRVTLKSSSLGNSVFTAPSTGTVKFAVIEPKRSALADGALKGNITLNGPPGPKSYQLRLTVDQFGRGLLCEPSAATDKLSDFGARRC